MLRLYACVVGQHDLRLVALAAAICILSCYAAVDLVGRARQSADRRQRAWSRTAAAVFGAGIWATHFIAELAYNPGLPLGYDIGLTALSLAAAAALAWLGISVALRHEAPLVGGGILGAAVGAMHYTGMAALRLPASIHWDPGFVLASLALGIGLCAAALRVIWRGGTLPSRVLGAALLVAGICGLHFVGMAAVTLAPDPRIVVAGAIVRSGPLVVAVAVVTLLIVALALAGVVADARMAQQAAREAARLRENEALLRRSQQHLALAQRVSRTGSVLRDVKTGVGEWSDELYRLLGIERGAIPPTFDAFLERVHEADRAALVEDQQALLRGERRGALREFRIIRPDGAVRVINSEVEPILDGAGVPSQMVVTVQDVTELRGAQARERDLERQLLHAQKLEALGTLAGGIAHDLNNTLVPVLALGKTTMRRLPEGSREHANLAMILKAGERARDLVHRILAFSRKDAPTRETVDIAALLRESLSMLASSLPSTIQIDESIADVPPVSADPGQMHQIIANLVINAAQAIGDKIGRVGVTLAAASGEILENGARAAIHVSISDSGCGMDEATRRRVFEPFFTTKEVGEGTGLGLSVVHGIIAEHGGRITVESRPGEGTRFDFYLPTPAAEAETPPVAPAAAAQ